MKQEHRVIDPFAAASYRKALAPALLSALGLALGDMADAVVLGQRMGATGLAAVSLALPVFMVINLLMHGMGAGGSIRFARALGAGHPRTAAENFTQVFAVTVGCGAVLALAGSLLLPQLMILLGAGPAGTPLYAATHRYVQLILWGMPVFFASYLLNYYLRNDDNQELAGRGFLAGNLADLALNLLLVLVLDLGVTGAALSTILGQCVALLLYLPGLGSRRHFLRFCPTALHPRELGRSFALGGSTSVQYLYQFIFYLLANRALMAGAGENGVAIFNVLQNLSYLVLYLYDGAAKAAQPLVSTYAAERNRAGSRSTRTLALATGNGLGILLCLALSLAAPAVCGVFGLTDPAALAAGAAAVRIYCLGLVLGGTNQLLESYDQARGREKRSLLLATLRGAAVLLPGTALFALLPVSRFWWLFPAVELVSLGLFALLAPRLAPEPAGQEPVLAQTISCTSRDIGALTRRVQDFCADHGADAARQYFAGMAVEEICLAAMEHLFAHRQDGIIQVTVVAARDGNFVLHFRDNGTRRDPFAASGAAEADPGIAVIRKKARRFFYRHYQGFNTLTIQI